jgi:hypothetical protein
MSTGLSTLVTTRSVANRDELNDYKTRVLFKNLLMTPSPAITLNPQQPTQMPNTIYNQ